MAGDLTREREVVDSLYRVLANQRRRQVIRLLAERDDPTTVADLTDRVRAADAGLDPSDRDRVALELHHSHLPMMDDAGVVEYDGEDRVARTPLGLKAADITQLADSYLHA